MRWLENTKVGVRLSLGFGVVVVLMIATIVVALRQGEVAREKLERIVKMNNVRLQIANSMIDDVREVSIALRTTLLLRNTEEARETKARIAESRKDFDSNFDKHRFSRRSTGWCLTQPRHGNASAKLC